MIKRIVKMTFRKDSLADFHMMFKSKSGKIRESEGCLYLELLEDVSKPNVIFTISIWRDECYLEKYRNSALFAETWKETKSYFADKPYAWSLESLEKVPLAPNENPDKEGQINH